ncbi:hypothetical protein ND748_20885 [Frankia sp. AiPs1]|uniref:hypothetical protein n=1 Tax=Frankia sp. AiPs1 TaxID=573493 RepID=UPI0020439FCB|nr:hypothetical protein [Frankia sp. AiPs1]MCM3924115.1 hypothetical protein [Frankia sp. AiPs1]
MTEAPTSVVSVGGVDGVASDARDAWMTDAWHRALLGLAGFLSDELISAARFWLAQGRRFDIAQAITLAVAAGRLDVGGAEIGLAREEFRAAGQEQDGLLGALDTLPIAERLLTAWEFRSGDPHVDGTATSLPVDLTAGVGPSELADTEQAILAAILVEPDAAGLWRTWRVAAAGAPWAPPKRVFAVTIEAGARPPAEVTARLQTALAAAGEPDPQVEVSVVGTETPSYQTLARLCGALLWSREPALGVSVARVFDAADPATGPRFAPDRPRITNAAVRARLLGYLDNGVALFGGSSSMPDLLDPARGEVVPGTFRTDGRWVWTDAVGYYLHEYGIAPEQEFRWHLEHGEPVERIDEVVLHRVLAVVLSRRREDEAAWVVPPTGEPAAPDAP